MIIGKSLYELTIEELKEELKEVDKAIKKCYTDFKWYQRDKAKIEMIINEKENKNE